MTSVDLPEPETPVTQMKHPSGNATSMCLRLCSEAPRTTSASPLPSRRVSGIGMIVLAGEVAAGERLGVAHDLLWRARRDDVPAVLARAGAEVDEVVGGAHHRLVVLDDEHGVAEVAEARERADEALVVDGVEADRRLVADVEHAHQRRADLRRQPDALPLAAR